MSTQWSPIHGSSHRHTVPSIPLRPNDTEDDLPLDGDLSGNLLHSQQSNYGRQSMASTSSNAYLYHFSEETRLPGLPTVKKIIYTSDLVAAATSLVCFALGALAVTNESISWHLGVRNNQLIAIGFLLSIMNLFLASVTPTLFILMEEKYGDSTIQNYDAILRNKPLASRLGVSWRIALSLMLALPIGLSVAYKTFTGGESKMTVNSVDYISNTTYFGMFQPPGITSYTGVSLFFNATTAFREATKRNSNDTEPPLPTLPQAYGYNILLLNRTSAAVLDTPQPDYLVAMQELLATGESWTITAPVIGTVATFNQSSTEDRTTFEKTFTATCIEAIEEDQWLHSNVDLYNNWSLTLTNRKLMSDQSVQYLGLGPQNPNCTILSHYVYLYNIYRQQCWGTWSITRGGFRLLEGFCDDAILPQAKQLPITYTILALQSWYMSPLMEMVGAFCGDFERGNQSLWMTPYMATSIATMLWSRIAFQRTPKHFNSETFNMSSGYSLSNGTFVTHTEENALYPVEQNSQTLVYNRPTLRKSPWLYLVLGIQPLLIVIILGLTTMLYSEPMSRGFGLVSILSGIDHQSLNSLAGASLSGELARPVKLTMSPVRTGETNTIKYRAVTSLKGLKRNGKLSRNVVYH